MCHDWLQLSTNDVHGWCKVTRHWRTLTSCRWQSLSQLHRARTHSTHLFVAILVSACTSGTDS